MSLEDLKKRYAQPLAVMNEDQLRRLASLFIVRDCALANDLANCGAYEVADKILEKADRLLLIATGGKEVEPL